MALWEPAGPDDHIAGVPARYVAAPDSTASASALLQAAAAENLAVGIRGAGTKLSWGMPPRALDLIVDTRRLTGVAEHAAGDLIAVVRAGTPVRELDFGTQELALDTPLPDATVGGTVAADTSGPRRLLRGTTRDLLIGITVVRPDGRVTRAGGKVVKNVAGYDLGKLYTGSYGTLGIVTECVFRLHPRSQARAVVSAPVPVHELGAVLAAVRAERVVPSAVELDAPAAPGGGRPGHVGSGALEAGAPPGTVTVAVLVEGTPEGVRDRASRLEKVLGGSVSAALPAWWGTYPWPAGGVGVKLGCALSRVPEVVAAAAGIPLRGSAGTGVLYASVPAADAARTVERLRAAAEHAVVLTAPESVRRAVDMWGPVPGLALMRRVKDQFDPAHRFAPGRFVGGI